MSARRCIKSQPGECPGVLCRQRACFCPRFGYIGNRKMIEQLSVSRDWPEDELREAFGPELQFGVDMAPFTSYGTGGPAMCFIRARNAQEIVRLMGKARQLKLPRFLLGGGSNLLVSDSGYNGIVIKVDVSGLSLVDETKVECGAGEELMALVDFATENDLTGMEFAAGIWGTVGGAIRGNAGAYGCDMGKVTNSVTIVDQQGNLKTEDAGYCEFDYRRSRFKRSGEVVVNVTLDLRKDDRAAITRKVNDILKSRKEKHPISGKSAGCFFKNVPDSTQPHGKMAAGKLLEDAGAKELRVGGAKVFEKHANIVVNTGEATSKDIRQLADMMKQRVLDRFGIELEDEVVSLGKF